MGCVGKANPWIPSVHLALIPIENCELKHTNIFLEVLCGSSNIFFPQVCPHWTVHFKGFYSHCVCAHFPRRNLFSISCSGSASPAAALCPLCHRSQKEELRDSVGKSGKDNISRRSTLLWYWNHPSISYPDPSFWGFWGSLLAEGNPPGGSHKVVRISEPSGWDGESQRQPLSPVQ